MNGMLAFLSFRLVDGGISVSASGGPPWWAWLVSVVAAWLGTGMVLHRRKMRAINAWNAMTDEEWLAARDEACEVLYLDREGILEYLHDPEIGSSVARNLLGWPFLLAWNLVARSLMFPTPPTFRGLDRWDVATSRVERVPKWRPRARCQPEADDTPEEDGKSPDPSD